MIRPNLSVQGIDRDWPHGSIAVVCAGAKRRILRRGAESRKSKPHDMRLQTPPPSVAAVADRGGRGQRPRLQ